ncbi:MAG TPA: DeoR/GlpR family DNA-binding transcription regulator [Candidatus Agathobaculum intestinipullorum]|nr:DeoR/GlpR family DNA-binding transcription regulator [Candidatus Agathobaculum intestinipullorum]
MQERREKIVELVNRLGTVSFAQLKAAFPDVSEMTLRTDLKALDEERRLVRVHGGAKSVEVVVGTDDFLLRRALRCAPEKAQIAQKTLALLRPDMTIYLDSGSTTTALARLIPDERFQIFTSSLSCANELLRLTRARVFLPGGFVNRYSQSLCGIEAVRTVGRINFDLALIGTTSFSDKTGFSCGMEEEAQLKRAVIAQAEQSYVLMDAGKVGLTSAFSFATLDEVDGIVSDDGLPTALADACRARGKQVL